MAAKPGEMLGPGEFLYLKNTRSLTPTTIQARNGYAKLNNSALADLNIHTIRRLNDYTISAATYVVGAGQKVYAGAGASLTALLTGFSGAPVSLVPARPSQSPAPWMYIGNANRMGKVGFISGVEAGYGMGVASGNTEAQFVLGGQPFKVVDSMDSAVGWTASAGVLTTPTRVSTTVSAILYDNGSTGYASIVPAAFTQNIQPRILLTIGAEMVQVHSVYNAIANTTIAAIRYASGSTGPCDIVLTTSSDALTQDALIRLDSGGAKDEYVRVEAVVEGPDGIKSIKATTTLSHAAAETVTGVTSFRAYCANTHAIADTITSNNLNLAIAAPGIVTLTKTVAVDLSNINNRPLGPDDDLHISLRVGDQSLITEIQVMLDVDETTNDFTQNYYYAAISPNDLTPNAAQSLTLLSTQQRSIQREQIRASYGGSDLFTINPDGTITVPDRGIFKNLWVNPDYAPLDDNDNGGVTYFDPGYVQAALGNAQWSEVVVKVSDLIRVGSDTTRTLKNVAAVRISFNVTGAVAVDADSWYVGGTYGPDEGTAQIGYLYAYRYRSRKTGGARSNLSPTPRALAKPHRELVTITGPYSADTQVDTVDIYRLGGTLSTWQYVGSVANPALGNWSFADMYPDQDVALNPPAELDFYQPFPTADLPRSGVCSVVGTRVLWTSGDTFNTSWARGSALKINGIPTRLQSSPESTTTLEITDNLGNLNNVAFELPNAIKLAQPMPVLVGPYTNGGPEYVFGLGDGSGNVYWTNPNEPDAASDRNFVTVTSPSEPLISGCMYDGRVLLFSTERMFFLVPDGQGGFIAQEVANSKGCYGNHTVCVGALVYFVGKDGIYESEGGQPRLISGPLFPLFPQEEKSNAEDLSPYLPAIDYGSPNSLRLGTYGNYLYFSYDGTDNLPNHRTLVWDIRRRCWISDDVYANPMNCHYGAEGTAVHGVLMGGQDGFIYELGESSDDAGVELAGQIICGSKYYEWWRHIRDYNIAYIGANDSTFTIVIDDIEYTYTLPAVGSLSNVYETAQAKQGKNFQYKFDFTSGFTLFAKDSAVEMKQWPHSGAYDKVLVLA